METHTLNLSEFEDIINMLSRFSQCRMYSIIDRLANATSRGAIYTSLYEAVRMAEAAIQKEDRLLCDKPKEVKAYVASREALMKLLNISDDRILVDIAKKIAIASLTPRRKEDKKEGV
ncbi:MAG: hypothetical protein DRO40_08670 [Thermoprotei archaeon]|nr:MAG: hypothetical protein DRO40_08670 [Thermoprotei archaeon]